MHWLVSPANKAESRAKIVAWVSKHLHPFSTVKDCRFQSSMKTGRLEYYLPFPEIVLCDMKVMFACTCKCVAKMLMVGIRGSYLMNYNTDALTKSTMEG